MPKDNNHVPTPALGLPIWKASPDGPTPPPEGPDPAHGIVTWGRLASVLGAFTGVLALFFAIFLFLEGRYASEGELRELRAEIGQIREQLLQVALRVGAKITPPPVSQPSPD